MFEFQYQWEIRTDLKRRGDVEKHDVQPAWCKSDGLARRHVDHLHDPMPHYISRHRVEVNLRPSRGRAVHRYQPITVGAPIDDGDIGGAGSCAFQRCPSPGSADLDRGGAIGQGGARRGRLQCRDQDRRPCKFGQFNPPSTGPRPWRRVGGAGPLVT